MSKKVAGTSCAPVGITSPPQESPTTTSCSQQPKLGSGGHCHCALSKAQEGRLAGRPRCRRRPIEQTTSDQRRLHDRSEVTYELGETESVPIRQKLSSAAEEKPEAERQCAQKRDDRRAIRMLSSNRRVKSKPPRQPSWTNVLKELSLQSIAGPSHCLWAGWKVVEREHEVAPSILLSSGRHSSLRPHVRRFLGCGVEEQARQPIVMPSANPGISCICKIRERQRQSDRKQKTSYDCCCGECVAQ